MIVFVPLDIYNHLIILMLNNKFAVKSSAIVK